MTGIFLILIIGLWAGILIWVVPKVVRPIRSVIFRSILGAALFFAFFIAPVADEIIGGLQFKELCSKAELIVDDHKARGRKVKSLGAKNTYLDSYAVTIRKQYWAYVDVDTGELLVSWNEYFAEGGWLIMALGISEASSPLTFTGVCRPEGARSPVFKKLNITKVDI